MGVPLKFTVKESDGNAFVKNTPDRSRIWEIQTPQVIHQDLIRDGFAKAEELKASVTDDVSLVELLNKQVKIVEGSHRNLKITTLEDLVLANKYLEDEI